MGKVAHHLAEYNLTKLELSLELAESSYGATNALRVGESRIDGAEPTEVTVSEHKWKRVPPLSLRLMLDPEHDLKAPEGTTLVVRGTAIVKAGDKSEQKKVALFRDNTDED
ncbi:hypothetical protein [Parasphingorhabdus sp.]|uniref:hypothetical protein n=1 Tax=Parasphingorhabdus sp. TaxID=2709688 RepID=UPI003C750C8C